VITNARIAIVIASLLTIAAYAAAADDLRTDDLAARIELWPIQTLTLTDQQFLTGNGTGKSVTIAGELRLPQGNTRRVPAVVMLHGSGGLGASVELWTHELNRLGIATFAVDSWSARGITSTTTDQDQAGFFTMIEDAYRARDLLAAHPRIDPEKIVLMGFSRGARASLYASLTRFRKTWAGGNDFAAYITLYAPCDSPTVIGDTDVTAKPIRMFHGTSDDYVAVAPCRSYVRRLKEARRDVTLTEYANVWHAYDNPLGSKTPAVVVKGQTSRKCDLREQPLGTIINAASGEPFTYKDPCVELDPHTAYNEVAMRDTHKAVTEFLRAQFNLK
jgi:dienelactone hydrolase